VLCLLYVTPLCTRYAFVTRTPSHLTIYAANWKITSRSQYEVLAYYRYHRSFGVSAAFYNIHEQLTKKTSNTPGLYPKREEKNNLRPQLSPYPLSMSPCRHPVISISAGCSAHLPMPSVSHQQPGRTVKKHESINTIPPMQNGRMNAEGRSVHMMADEAIIRTDARHNLKPIPPSIPHIPSLQRRPFSFSMFPRNASAISLFGIWVPVESITYWSASESIRKLFVFWN